MFDLGFRVSATDYRRDGFKLESARFIQADLNQAFAALPERMREHHFHLNLEGAACTTGRSRGQEHRGVGHLRR
jgi:hypothetical protein